jgi:hypothetical protein
MWVNLMPPTFLANAASSYTGLYVDAAPRANRIATFHTPPPPRGICAKMHGLCALIAIFMSRVTAYLFSK